MSYTVKDIMAYMRVLLRQPEDVPVEEFTPEDFRLHISAACREAQRLLKAIDSDFFIVEVSFDMVDGQNQYDLTKSVADGGVGIPGFRGIIDLFRNDLGTPRDPVFMLEGGWDQARAYETLQNPLTQFRGIMRRHLAGNILWIFPTPQVDFDNGFTMKHEDAVVPAGKGFGPGDDVSTIGLPDDWYDWIANQACAKCRNQDERNPGTFYTEAQRLLKGLLSDFRNRDGKDNSGFAVRDVSGYDNWEA